MAKRTTVAELEREFYAKIGPLENKVKVLGHTTEKLRRAKRTSGHVIGRHLGAHAALESEVASLSKRFNELVEKMSSDDPAVIKAASSEFVLINERLDQLFGAASTELAAQRTEHDELVGVVAGLRSDHNTLREDHDAQVRRHNRLTHRVFRLEQLKDYVPWHALVIGLVVAFIVGILWWNLFHYSETTTLADGSTVTIAYETARTVGAPFVGLAVGALIATIFTFLSRSRSEEKVAQEREEVPPVPTRTSSSTESGTPATAPTKVFETQGAKAGAR